MTKWFFLFTAIAIAISAFCQAPAVGHKYEVVSIKGNPAGGNQFFIDDRPGPRFVANNVPLRLLLRRAFRLQDSQIVGGPNWMNSDAFDIEAKAEQPLSVEEIGPALQALLQERFRLQAHRDMRELPVYILTVGKGGAKIKASDTNYPGGGPTFGTAGYFRATSRPVSSLGNYLSPLLGRPERFLRSRAALCAGPGPHCRGE